MRPGAHLLRQPQRWILNPFISTAPAGADGGQIPVSAQWPETTMLVSVDSTRDVEFVASDPGDWAMHCHMTHHIMNQVGLNITHVVGIKPDDLDRQIEPLLPGYMAMGHEGIYDIGEMDSPWPKNSIP